MDDRNPLEVDSTPKLKYLSFHSHCEKTLFKHKKQLEKNTNIKHEWYDLLQKRLRLNVNI